MRPDVGAQFLFRNGDQSAQTSSRIAQPSVTIRSGSERVHVLPVPLKTAAVSLQPPPPRSHLSRPCSGRPLFVSCVFALAGCYLSRACRRVLVGRVDLPLAARSQLTTWRHSFSSACQVLSLFVTSTLSLTSVCLLLRAAVQSSVMRQDVLVWACRDDGGAGADGSPTLCLADASLGRR